MGKEAISRIREVLGEDSSKVEAHLKAIEGDYNKFKVDLEDLQETIKHVNTESKNRKLKIRELESNLEDKDGEIETLKKSDKSEELGVLQEKVKKYEEAEAEAVKAKGKVFIDKFDKLKDHADWDKAKSNFNIPSEKDGKLDWESMDINDVAKNADKLSEYEGLGHFADINPSSEERSVARSKTAKSDGPFTDDDFK